MPLGRAFTMRLKRTGSSSKFNSNTSSNDSNNSTLRSSTMKTKTFDRSQISAPVALISTTNVLSYNAPDISTIRQVRKTSSSLSSGSVSSSRHSGDRDSDASSPHSRDAYLTDASSVTSSPTSPHHKSANTTNSFMSTVSDGRKSSPPGRATSSTDLRGRSASLDRSPKIPDRAPSHSKFSHERAPRQRSLQRTSPQSSSSPISQQQDIRSPTSHPRQDVRREQRTTMDFFSSKVEVEHPFGRELEQLEEIAEEFGGAVRDAEREADLAVMREKGLRRFCADDYMREIEPLVVDAFQVQQSVVWI